MATKRTKSNDTAVAAEIGAGIIAAGAAAAAGYYFYASKNAKRHRQAAAKWAQGLKGDVEKEVKKLKELDRKSVAGIVDAAAKAYAGARNVDPVHLKAAVKELKANWKQIGQKEEAKKPTAKKAPAKAARKPAKKAAKK